MAGTGSRRAEYVFVLTLSSRPRLLFLVRGCVSPRLLWEPFWNLLCLLLLHQEDTELAAPLYENTMSRKKKTDFGEKSFWKDHRSKNVQCSCFLRLFLPRPTFRLHQALFPQWQHDGWATYEHDRLHHIRINQDFWSEIGHLPIPSDKNTVLSVWRIPIPASYRRTSVKMKPNPRDNKCAAADF